MSIYRTIECAVCGARKTESSPNEGWHGWGHVAGIVLDGAENPTICPKHLAAVANFIDTMKKMGDH